jgi:glycosyltransferase involved in cell wall biosynthesis
VIHTNPRSSRVFSPAQEDEDRRAARHRLGVPADGISVGFIGELDYRKGSMVLMDALDQYGSRAGGERIWAAVAGRGPLEELIKERASRNGAFFLGGLTFPDGVRDFFRSMDIICVPSRTTPDSEEQSPRVVVEAMMSGCLVIVSSCGANPEMVGDRGLIVPEDDPQKLRDAILAAADLVRRGNPLGREAATLARNKYSADAVAMQLVDVWRRALQRRRSFPTGG